MSEGAKVEKIMEALHANPVSKLEAGGVAKAIGYPVSLPDQVVQHPTESYPVVWYKMQIVEICEWEERRTQRDADGNTRTVTDRKSKRNTIFNSEVGCEFRLVDGKTAAIVDCRNKNQSKIKTRNNQTGRGMPTGKLNPAVASFVNGYPRKDNALNQAVGAVQTAAAQLMGAKNHTGRLNERWSYSWSCSFVDTKAKIAVIGDCKEDANQQLRLDICYENTADEDQLVGQGLDKAQVGIFKDMVKNGGAIFISDTDQSIGVTQVAPADVEQSQAQPQKDSKAGSPIVNRAPQPAQPQQPVYVQQGQPVDQPPPFYVQQGQPVVQQGQPVMPQQPVYVQQGQPAGQPQPVYAQQGQAVQHPMYVQQGQPAQQPVYVQQGQPLQQQPAIQPAVVQPAMQPAVVQVAQPAGVPGMVAH